MQKRPLQSSAKVTKLLQRSVLIEIGVDSLSIEDGSSGFGWGVFLYHHQFHHWFANSDGSGWGELSWPW